jgi:IMP dehydrogenase
MNRAVCFDDVLLVPQYSEIESRSSVDLSVPGFDTSFMNLVEGKPHLTCPIVGSPMDTVIGPVAAAVLADVGGFGVLHRYCSIEETRQAYLETTSMGKTSSNNVMVAIGATGDYLERAAALYSVGCRAFCVDVAHGHHVNVKNALSALRSRFGKSVHIMTGNVATLEAFNALADWGSDSIRVGVGGGSMCTTRVRTGHGIPTLQSVIDCAKSDRDVYIIADGGIRNSGDAVKALAAGADMVMLGSILAGHDESPGEIVDKRGVPHSPNWKNDIPLFKKFRGMASREAQLEWRGKVSVVEGDSTLVPYKGSMRQTLIELMDGVRSGLSYSGARTIRELRAKAKFIGVSSSGVRENGSHGKNS